MSDLLVGRTVAIVGGGPAGLTLARMLQLRGVEARVFERDSAADARSQGGSLDLHEGSGQLALTRCGLERGFRSVSRPEGQELRVFDRNGELRAAVAPEDEAHSSPEIDRGALRDLLLGSLAPETVAWGQRVDVVAEAGDGRYELAFSSGRSFTADLVVGCDGTGSRVRALVSAVKPAYCGMTFVETRFADVDRRHSEVARLVGAGSALCLGEGKGLLFQRNGDGSVRLYVALRVGAGWLRESGLDFGNAEATRTRLLEHFSGWAEPLLALLRRADQRFHPWPLYTLPPDQAWEPRPGLTLMGDAAHVMPPFTGQGANMAMPDAVELADHLTAGAHPTLTHALAAFERGMLARMTVVIRETLASQEQVFASDAPRGLVESIRDELARNAQVAS